MEKPKKTVKPYSLSSLEVSKLFNYSNDFKNERELCNYIEDNIKLFCSEVLLDNFVSYMREYHFVSENKFRGKGFPRKGQNNIRIDFMIRCKNNLYAIEVKNPIQKLTELSRTIGQLMLYEEMLEEKNINAKIVLVSSKHDEIISKLIAKHNLNYRYILFNKKYQSELEGQKFEKAI